MCLIENNNILIFRFFVSLVCMCFFCCWVFFSLAFCCSFKWFSSILLISISIIKFSIITTCSKKKETELMQTDKTTTTIITQQTKVFNETMAKAIKKFIILKENTSDESVGWWVYDSQAPVLNWFCLKYFQHDDICIWCVFGL